VTNGRTYRQICPGYYNGLHCEQYGRAVKTVTFLKTPCIFYLTKILIIFYDTTVQRARDFGTNFGIFIVIFVRIFRGLLFQEETYVQYFP